MAITGIFGADFTTFNAAVDGAEVKLRGFEGNAAKVESALSKMTNGFSGTKVIQDATLMAEAVERVGGASVLTAKEQAQVNSVVAEGIAKYTALGQVAPKAMTDLEEATRKTSTVTDTLKENWAALSVATGAAVIGIQQVASKVTGWVEASGQQETALKKVEAALRAQGSYTPELVAAYGAMADEFQRTTINADEVTNEMQALFVTVGDVGPDQMEKALQAAMDLSAGLGIDLKAAVTMLGKAAASDGESLGKLKVILGDNMKEGAGFAGVLDAVNDKFRGQATAVAAGTGQLTIAKNVMGEAEEKAGKLVMNALAPLAKAFLDMPEGMQTVIAVMGMVASVAAPLAMAIGGISTAIGVLGPIIMTTAVPALGAVVTAIGAVALPITIAVAAVGALYLAFTHWDQITAFVEGVYTAVKTWLVDKWGALSDGVKVGIDKILGFFRDMPARVTEYAKAIYDGMYQWLVGKLGAIWDSIKRGTEAVTGFFRDMYEKVVGHSYISDMVEGIDDYIGRLPAVMADPAAAATAAVSGSFGTMKDETLAYVGDAVSGIDSMINAMGDAASATELTASSVSSSLQAMTQGVEEYKRAYSSITGGENLAVGGGNNGAGGGWSGGAGGSSTMSGNGPQGSSTMQGTMQGTGGPMSQWDFRGRTMEDLNRIAGILRNAAMYAGAGGQLAAIQLRAVEEAIARGGINQLHSTTGAPPQGTQINVTVDSRGAFYDDPESVQRLADKVGQAVINRVGR